MKDNIVKMDILVKENLKFKKIQAQNIQEIKDSIKRPNLLITGIEEEEEIQIKGRKNIFNNIRRKYPQPKEVDAYQATRNIWNRQ